MISLEALRSADGRTGCGFDNLVVLRQVGSTNDCARRFVEAIWSKGAQMPRLAILADEQTAGRGRQGRSWVSDRGLGVYATVVWFPRAEHLQALPLLVGVGLARGLRTLGCEAGLKWPNDLLVRGRKIGGILIETLTREGGETVAMIGFGVNHGHSASDLPTPQATSLREEVEEVPNLDSTAGILLRSLALELGNLHDEVYARREYEELSVHRRGDRLRCRLGGESVDGTFLGFDHRGFLRLEVEGRERVMNAGEVYE